MTGHRAMSIRTLEVANRAYGSMYVPQRAQQSQTQHTCFRAGESLEFIFRVLCKLIYILRFQSAILYRSFLIVKV